MFGLKNISAGEIIGSPTDKKLGHKSTVTVTHIETLFIPVWRRLSAAADYA